MAGRLLEILTELHDHGVDFVIVGGVAAALHGGSRATFDLDIVPSLAPDSWQAAVDLLWALGARPRIPEPLERIRDVEHVRRWRVEKNMLALNFRTSNGTADVDLLVSHSDQFEQLRRHTGLPRRPNLLGRVRRRPARHEARQRPATGHPGHPGIAEDLMPLPIPSVDTQAGPSVS